MRITKRTAAMVAMVAAVSACGRGAAADDEETAQAAGDVLASLDELADGGRVSFRLHRPELEKGTLFERAVEAVIPSAWAASCSTARFGTCTDGVRTKTWDACVLGGVKFDGSVTLTFSRPACGVIDAGDSVTRTADFTIDGRADSAFTVSSPGGGQKFTKTATGFDYEVLGLERKLDVGSRTVFDVTAKTTAPLHVTGADRQGRVVDGGTLEIKHAQAGTTATLTPANLTWDGTCNCPVSGAISGTVTGRLGKTSDFTTTITGCGTATVTVGTETQDVMLDRCGAL